jgi:hypothetical protein
MVDSVADIASRLRRIADEIERADRSGDWVDAHYCADDIRSSDEVALICKVSSDTVVRETRMLIAHYRPQWDTRDFVREVATGRTGCGRRGRATCRARPRLRGRFGSPMQSALVE